MSKWCFYFVIFLSMLTAYCPVNAHGGGGGHGGGHCCGHFGGSHLGLGGYNHCYSGSRHHPGALFRILRSHSHSHYYQQNYPYFYNCFGYWPLFWLLPYYWSPYFMNSYPYYYSNAMLSYPYSYNQPIMPSGGPATKNQFSNYPPIYNLPPTDSSTVCDGTTNTKEPDKQTEPF